MDSFRFARIFGWIPASVCIFAAAAPVWAQNYAPVPEAPAPTQAVVSPTVSPAVPAAQVVPAAPTTAPAAADAPIVPHEDGSSERPMPAPFVLSAQEQAQTDAVLTRWEQFSTAIQTFEAAFTRIMYKRSFDSANLEKTTERGELRSNRRPWNVCRHTMAEIRAKVDLRRTSVFEYKFAQNRLISTLCLEMREKELAGPLTFLFGASVEE